MKSRIIFLIFFVFTFISIIGQTKEIDWNKLQYLVGEWKGEGSGKPGEGEGTFSFSFDLDKNVLVRKSHSVYPAANGRPETIHDDLLIIYPNLNGSPEKAIYFDNEGHVINYNISFPAEDKIYFTSDQVAGIPVFRLGYIKQDENKTLVRFEMSQDGESFKTYVEGISRKTGM